MKIIIKKVGTDPEIREFKAMALSDMQGIVGGYIERVPLEGFMPDAFDGSIDLYCNEEGKLRDGWTRRINFTLPAHAPIDKAMDAVVGDVLFVGTDSEGETIGLTDAQIEHVLNVFGWK